ncbi:MAG: PAS domain S-box protein [Bacteroidota bacterium]
MDQNNGQNTGSSADQSKDQSSNAANAEHQSEQTTQQGSVNEHDEAYKRETVIETSFSNAQVRAEEEAMQAVKLDYDLDDLDSADLNNLRNELKALRQDKAELERKRFVDNSLSRFTEIMRLRVDSTLETWADNLLAELVPFVEGLQAALFMVDEHDDGSRKLRCIGGYAMPKDALRELEIGQGVTGQAAKNGKVLYFSSDDNFESHTESSLSKIDAEVLLVQPLIQNETVEGVLELTSLEGLSKDKREFLEELSDSMAGTLVTLRNQVRIQDLFQEAQQRQEELQAQEEEMRQNVEELQATQEEMKRLQKQAENSEKRIRSMMNNIPMGVVVLLKDKTPFFANQQAEKLLERDFNDIDRLENFTDTFNFKKPGTDERYEKEEQMMDAISAGEEKRVDDVEMLRKDGTRMPLELTGAAVTNDKGEVSFIIITLADISDRKLQEQEIRAQNEELGAREEEMRQNLEELEATQEQMKHMQQRAERQKLILDAILDSNSDTIIAVDTDMKILAVNKVVRDQYEASGIKIKTGKPIFDYLPEEQHKSYKEKFGRALQGERFTENHEYAQNGATTYYEIDYYPIKSRRDEIIGAASVASDVSERYEQMNMLREIQRSLTVINEVTPIIEFTPEGVIQRVNDKAQELFGYSANELINHHHRMLVPEHIKNADAYKQMWEKIGRGEMYGGTFERINKDGETIYLQGNYTPIYDQGGELYRVAKVAVDVTEEVKSRAEADRAEAQLQKLVKEAPIGVCVTKPDYTFEQVNQAYLDIYGFEKMEDVIGKPFTIVTKTDDVDFWKKKHDDFLAGEDETRGKFTVVHHDGHEMTIMADSTRITGADGEPRKVTYVLDITEQQAREERLATMVKEAPIGVCLTNPDAVFEEVNQKYLEIYGFKNEEDVIGKPFTIVTKPDEEEFWLKKHEDFLETGDEVRGRFTVKNTRGEEMTIHADSTRIVGPDGRPRKVTYVIDIDDLKIDGEAGAAQPAASTPSLPGYLPAGAWSWNLQDDSVELSEELRNLLGHTKKSWKQDKDYLHSLIHPDDLPTFNALADDYLAGKQTQHNQKLRLKQKDGAYLAVRNFGELMKDADDKPLKITGVMLAC